MCVSLLGSKCKVSQVSQDFSRVTRLQSLPFTACASGSTFSCKKICHPHIYVCLILIYSVVRDYVCVWVCGWGARCSGLWGVVCLCVWGGGGRRVFLCVCVCVCVL